METAIPPLPLFRSPLQARLLALVLLNPDRWWTTEELRARLDASAPTLHRELHRVLAAGVLQREAIGRTFRYRAATASPIYEPVRQILERTLGIEAELKKIVESTDGADAALIYGSFVRGVSLRPASDVDLLVIGDVDLRALRRRLRAIERRTGREIDVVAYTPDEFRAMHEAGNSFAEEVVDKPAVVLVGSLDDVLRHAE